MTILTDIDQIDRHAWSSLVGSSATASAFQTPECYDLFASVAYFRPFVLAAVADDGELLAVVSGAIYRDGNGPVMRYFSRRAIIYGGPLLSSRITLSELQQLMEAVGRYLSGRAIYVETHNFADFSAYQPALQAAGFLREPHLDYIVETPPDEAVVFGRIQRRKREQIRSALRHGAEICDSPTDADIRDFYPLFRRLHHAKAHTPVPPVEFFLALAHSPIGRIVLVRHRGRTIAGSAILTLPGRAVYHLYVAGDDEHFRRLAPSSVAHYSVMRYAALNGFRRCDLCGAGRPDDHYGVRDFKAKLGGTLVEWGRNKKVLNRFLYRLGTIAVTLFKHL